MRSSSYFLSIAELEFRKKVTIAGHDRDGFKGFHVQETYLTSCILESVVFNHRVKALALSFSLARSASAAQ